MNFEGHEHDSVLPMLINQSGSEQDPVEESIVCVSISGGADYNDDMPKELTLLRRLEGGQEYTMRYVQREGA